MNEPTPSISGCKMCGKCCRFSWSFCIVKDGDFEQEKLARFQGGIDLGYAIALDLPCRYLDLKTNLCKIHDSPDRPEPCKKFGPDEKHYHPDGCAFVSTDHNSRDWKIRNSGRWKGQE
jgi:Fe-S-cluster containining protein